MHYWLNKTIYRKSVYVGVRSHTKVKICNTNSISTLDELHFFLQNLMSANSDRDASTKQKLGYLGGGGGGR